MEKPYQNMLHHILECLPEEELFLFIQEAIPTLSPEHRRELLDGLRGHPTAHSAAAPEATRREPLPPPRRRGNAPPSTDAPQDLDQLFKQFAAQAGSSFQNEQARMRRQLIGCFVGLVVTAILLIAGMNWELLVALFAE